MQNNYMNMEVTSKFGERNDPITGKLSVHFGIDCTNEESLVYSGLSGNVSLSRLGEWGEGYFVQVKAEIHNATFFCNHFHNTHNYVHEGDNVLMNNVIAQMGSTGRTTGPHIHLEICTYEKNNSFVKKLKKEIPFVETDKRIYFDPLRLYEYFITHGIKY